MTVTDERGEVAKGVDNQREDQRVEEQTWLFLLPSNIIIIMAIITLFFSECCSLTQKKVIAWMIS